jgi:hypothetical protein
VETANVERFSSYGTQLVTFVVKDLSTYHITWCLPRTYRSVAKYQTSSDRQDSKITLLRFSACSRVIGRGMQRVKMCRKEGFLPKKFKLAKHGPLVARDV